MGFGSILTAAIGAGSSMYAARQQRKAAKRAAQLQQQQFQQTRDMLAPQIEQGQQASQQYTNAIGANGYAAQQNFYDNFENDPGFEEALQAGLTGINRSAASRGQGLGGNVLAALQDYGQRQQHGAYQNRLGHLSNLSGQGQNAINALAGYGAGAAQTSGNYLSQAGNAMAQGGMNMGNSLTGSLNDYSFYRAYRGA